MIIIRCDKCKDEVYLSRSSDNIEYDFPEKWLKIKAFSRKRDMCGDIYLFCDSCASDVLEYLKLPPDEIKNELGPYRSNEKKKFWLSSKNSDKEI